MNVHEHCLYVGASYVSKVYLSHEIIECIHVCVDIGDRTQSRVIPRMFYDMWSIGTTASMALIIVFGQNRELHTIKTEVKNGMVGAVKCPESLT